MHSFRIALLLSLSLFAPACSDDPATSPAADTGVASDTGSVSDTAPADDTGAPADDTGAPADGAADAPAGCGTVAKSGSAIPEIAGSGAYPAPAGGTLGDGTYTLTKHEIYPPGSVDAYTRQQTIKISGSSFEFVSSRDGGADERFSGTFSTSGSTLTLSITCPASVTRTYGYTATATELRLFESDVTTMNELFTFVKM